MRHQALAQVVGLTVLRLFAAPPVLVKIRRDSLEPFVHRFGFGLSQSRWTKEKSCFVSAFRSDLLNVNERFISCGGCL